MTSWPMGHMKDGGGGQGAELGSKSEGGSELSSMVVVSEVLLPQMEHRTKRKEESYQGMWAAAIVPPNTAKERTTRTGGSG